MVGMDFGAKFLASLSSAFEVLHVWIFISFLWRTLLVYFLSHFFWIGLERIVLYYQQCWGRRGMLNRGFWWLTLQEQYEKEDSLALRNLSLLFSHLYSFGLIPRLVPDSSSYMGLPFAKVLQA